MNLPSSSRSNKKKLAFWNNWHPPKRLIIGGKSDTESDSDIETEAQSITFENEGDSKFRNWIPPNFLRKNKNAYRETVRPEKLKEVSKKQCLERKSIGYIKKLGSVPSTTNWSKNARKREFNLDWGKRQLLHSIVNPSYEDLIWSVVNLGVFGHIKLWINNYGNLCGSAEGTISTFQNSNKIVVSITNTDHLRKMLNVSTAQWASLCEIVANTKACLKFDAFRNLNSMNASSLEKMWFFLCRRRHLLPDQCMLVKYTGAIKCLRELEIMPKYVVQDIRDIEGNPIS